MANGDAAAAKGWTTFPPSQAHSNGHDNDNYVLDKVAAEQDRAITAEGLKLDAAKIQVSATENPAWPNGTIWLKPLA